MSRVLAEVPAIEATEERSSYWTRQSGFNIALVRIFRAKRSPHWLHTAASRTLLPTSPQLTQLSRNANADQDAGTRQDGFLQTE